MADSKDEDSKRSVFVREATDEEQRAALERAAENYQGSTLVFKPSKGDLERAVAQWLGLEGVTFQWSADGQRLEGVVSEPVVMSQVTFRQASGLPRAGESSTLVLSCSGRSVERIVGPRPAGWGYVVRSKSGGIALEVVVHDPDPRLSWRSIVSLVHRRTVYREDEHSEEGIQKHCELVGGACASEGPGWQFHDKMEELTAKWPIGVLAPGSQELAALWEVMEEQLETWLR